MPRKKGEKSVVKLYFGEKEEDAALKYVLSTSFSERNLLYRTILEKPFRRMVESILRKYPIHIGNYETEDLEFYALSHLCEQMIKYRPFIIEFKDKSLPEDEKWTKFTLDSGKRYFYVNDAEKGLADCLATGDTKRLYYRIFESKAFSYCQTIVRNFFKDHGRKSYTEKIQNLAFEDFHEEIETKEEYMYEIDHSDEIELQELITKVISSLRSKIDTDKTLKKNEIIVCEAIIDIMTNWNILFLEDTEVGKYGRKVSNNFTKNKILLFLKEQTNLSTKEIRSSMKQFRELYFLEKTDFFNET
jgi:hypothetical protein